MKSISTKLPLIRANGQYEAALALAQGDLNTGKSQLDKLHPQELAIYQNYQYNRRKESYLLGRLSAKQAIQELSGINNPSSIWIDTGVFQFPIVKGEHLQNMQVSISHCDTIGCSIAYREAHPMGIDVEKISVDKTEVVLSQLTQSEKLLLTTNANIYGYTALFSIKEALSKILKTGMMLEFKFLEVKEIKETKDTIECTFSNFGQYKAFAFIQKKYVFAVALPKRTTMPLDPIIRLLKDGQLDNL